MLKPTLFVLLLIAIGCGDNNTSNNGEQDEHNHSGESHDGHNHGDHQSSIDVGSCIAATNTLQTESGVQIDFASIDDSIPLNQLFTLTVRISNVPMDVAVTIDIDATMPAHGHGMNTIPTIEVVEGSNEFEVSNMILHMPGEWELRVLVIHGEVAEQVRTTLDCAEGS